MTRKATAAATIQVYECTAHTATATLRVQVEEASVLDAKFSAWDRWRREGHTFNIWDVYVRLITTTGRKVK